LILFNEENINQYLLNTTIFKPKYHRSPIDKHEKLNELHDMG